MSHLRIPALLPLCLGAALLSVAARLPPVADTPDMVTLTKGPPQKGRVVYEDRDILLLRVGTREKQFAQADITDVHSITRSLNTLLDRLGGADAGLTTQAQAELLLELATFAQENDLPGEARLLFLKVLLTDPSNPDANAALGNRQKDGKWTYTHNKRGYSTTELEKVGKDWGDRWTLETTHFKLLSNLDIAATIDAAIDLERQYRAFYGLFQEHLRLLDIVEEKMLVELHGDKGSYPENTGGRKGYYDPASFTLYIDASTGLDPEVFAHEATHQILFVTTQRTRGAKGKIPAWMDEGLAEYFGAALTGRPGHVNFNFGTSNPGHFTTIRGADKRMDLNRVLTLEGTDFLASTDAALKYAESWALVQYGLHGADGSNREACLDFLKRAYEGKSSMSEFKKTISVDPAAYEKAWFAWIDKA